LTIGKLSFKSRIEGAKSMAAASATATMGSASLLSSYQ